jgi:hypothetical protein
VLLNLYSARGHGFVGAFGSLVAPLGLEVPANVASPLITHVPVNSAAFADTIGATMIATMARLATSISFFIFLLLGDEPYW